MKIEPNENEYRSWMEGREFHLVTTENEYNNLIDQCISNGEFGFDTEGTGLHPIKDHICGLCLAPDIKHGYYIPTKHEEGTNIDLKVAHAGLKRLMESDALWVMWNASFDIGMLWNEGDDFLHWLEWRKWFDAMIGWWLADSRRKGLGLKKVGQANGYEMIELWQCFGHKRKPKGFIPTVNKLDPLNITVYGSSDSIVTLAIKKVIANDKWFKMQQSVFALEMATCASLVYISRCPAYFDLEYIEEWKPKIAGEIKCLEYQIHKHADGEFNIGSTKQLAEVLFVKLGLPVLERTEKKGDPKTGDEVLDQLKDKHPIIPLLQEWRHLSKFMSSYLQPFIRDNEDGKALIGYFQPATETGRMQGRKGNFEVDGRLGMSITAIPKNRAGDPTIYDPRRAFCAPPGFIIYAVDFANEEMRLVANMSGEEKWLEALGAGRNMHREMASLMYKKPYDQITKIEYATAKAANFKYLYGGGNPKEEIYQIYYSAIPTLKLWQDRQKGMAQTKGYVQTAWGRIRQLADLVNSREWKKKLYGLRQAVNSPVQGTGGDVLKIALSKIVLGIIFRKYPELRGYLYVIFLVHDEIGGYVATTEYLHENGLTEWTTEKILYLVCEAMASVGLPDWTLKLDVDGHLSKYWTSVGAREFLVNWEDQKIYFPEKEQETKPTLNAFYSPTDKFLVLGFSGIGQEECLLVQKVLVECEYQNEDNGIKPGVVGLSFDEFETIYLNKDAKVYDLERIVSLLEDVFKVNFTRVKPQFQIMGT